MESIKEGGKSKEFSVIASATLDTNEGRMEPRHPKRALTIGPSEFTIDDFDVFGG